MWDEEEEVAYHWMDGDSLAPPCQAEMNVITAILNLAAPYLNDQTETTESCLVDLGCGDGRICIEATRIFKCKSIGCEIEPHLVTKFNINIQRIEDESLIPLISIVEGDLRDFDLSVATVIVVYLLPESVELISSKLREAVERGTILICNTWGPKNMKATKKIFCGFSNNVSLYLFDKSSLDL